MSERYTDRPGKPYGAPPTDDHPFVVEVTVPGGGDGTRNGLSFETVEDADSFGFDLSMRWFGMEGYRVVNALTGEVVKS